MTRALDAWFWRRGDRPVDALQLRQLPRPRQPRGPRIHHPFAREDARQDARGDAGRLRGPPAGDLRRARAAAHRAARARRGSAATTPNYADYRILGSILFTASVCRTARCWPTDDPLRAVDRALPRPVRRARPPSGAVRPVRPQAARGRPAAVHARPGQGGIHKRNTGPESTRAETRAHHRRHGESLMRVLVTRRWPAEVERALQERFEVVLNEADRPLEPGRAGAGDGRVRRAVPDRVGQDRRGGDRRRRPGEADRQLRRRLRSHRPRRGQGQGHRGHQHARRADRRHRRHRA